MMDSMEKSMRTLSSAARNRTKKYTTKNTERVKSICKRKGKGEEVRRRPSPMSRSVHLALACRVMESFQLMQCSMSGKW